MKRKRLSSVSELLAATAEHLRQGNWPELPMPSKKEGNIVLPPEEPVEGIEVSPRRQFTRLRIDLSWSRPRETP